MSCSFVRSFVRSRRVERSRVTTIGVDASRSDSIAGWIGLDAGRAGRIGCEDVNGWWYV